MVSCRLPFFLCFPTFYQIVSRIEMLPCRPVFLHVERNQQNKEEYGEAEYRVGLVGYNPMVIGDSKRRCAASHRRKNTCIVYIK